MIWLFVLFLLIFVCALVGVFNEERTGLCHFMIVLLASAGIVLTMVFMFERATPVISDVPEKAHIDTIVTIRGNDTVYSYQIEWNDNDKN